MTRFVWHHPSLLVLVATFLAAMTPVGVAYGSEVSGRVVDDDGAVLAGANVVLRDVRSSQVRYGDVTDAEGRFSLAAAAGTYRLEVTYVGYEAYREVVVVEAAPVHVTVQLRARAIPHPEVLLMADRARPQLTPITYSNLTPRDLEQKPGMKDLPVLLASLPSITYYSENGNGIGYSHLSMRGFDQLRVAVSINGIPQNDPEAFDVFWINFFDIQGAITDVQVQRGAGASVYGPTGIGGAINIVAKPYKPYPYATVEVGAGAFGTRRYTVEANSGLLGDRYVAFGRLSRLLSDGYRDWSWTQFWRFFTGVTRYGEHSTLTVQAYGGPQDDGLAYTGIPKAANDAGIADGFGGTIDRRYNFSAFTQDVEHFHQPHLEVLHDWDAGPRATLHQKLFWVKGIGYFDFDGTFRSADYLRLPAGFRDLSPADRAQPLYVTAPDASLLFRAFLDQWQVGWLPSVVFTSRWGETTLGGEARLHRSLHWGRIQEATGIPADLVGSANDVRVYSVRGEKAIASVYGRHLARLTDDLAVQGDLQLTYRHYRVYDERFFGTHFKTPYLFVNPRLGVTLFPEQPFSAYASVALAGREPRLKSLYDGEEAGAGFQPRFERGPDDAFDFDHPLVDPEHLLDVELGAEVNRLGYRLSGNVFWMDFRDEIVPSGGLDQFGVPRTGNADRTRHYGLELEGAVRVTPHVDVYANATLARARIVRFTEFVTLPDFSVAPAERDGNPIAGFPEASGSANVTYHRKGFTGVLYGKYAGRQYVDNSAGHDPDGTQNDDLTVDPYLLVDARLSYAFPAGSALEGLSLSLDVNNVLNDRVLLFGNVGFGTPQFFPAATRHAFLGAKYTLR